MAQWLRIVGQMMLSAVFGAVATRVLTGVEDQRKKEELERLKKEDDEFKKAILQFAEEATEKLDQVDEKLKGVDAKLEEQSTSEKAKEADGKLE